MVQTKEYNQFNQSGQHNTLDQSVKVRAARRSVINQTGQDEANMAIRSKNKTENGEPTATDMVSKLFIRQNLPGLAYPRILETDTCV